MSKLNEYSIHFTGLKEGKHEFIFHIKKDFFSEFPNEDINDADINVKVNFEKNARYLALDFSLKGNVQTTCDRCLDNLKIDIDYSPSLHVNFGDENSDLTDIDDVMTLSRSEEKLELAKHLFDYIMINMPIQRVHSDYSEQYEGCNPEMIKQIEKYELGESSDNEGEIDPRWEKLKNLYN